MTSDDLDIENEECVTQMTSDDLDIENEECVTLMRMMSR